MAEFMSFEDSAKNEGKFDEQLDLSSADSLVTVDDAEKRANLEKVEKIMSAITAGARSGDSVVATIQKLITFEPLTIKMITDLLSAYDVTVVDAHALFLDELFVNILGRVNGLPLADSGVPFVVSDKPVLAGGFEREVLLGYLQYRVSVEGKRAESAFKALNSAKLVEENSVETKRSNVDRAFGRNKRTGV